MINFIDLRDSKLSSPVVVESFCGLLLTQDGAPMQPFNSFFLKQDRTLMKMYKGRQANFLPDSAGLHRSVHVLVFTVSS